MTQTSLSKRLYEALLAAKAHLEYCGYGDYWERECAHEAGLEDLIYKALQEYEKRDNPPEINDVSDTDGKSLGSRHRGRRVARVGDTDMVRDLD